MSQRECNRQPTALRPVGGRVCLVMVCANTSEADQIGRQLSELDMGCLVTYRRAEDMMFNAPRGKVALVILAGQDTPVRMRQTLQWLRSRWPGCPITVVGDDGCGTHERTARQGGAMYLTRPVAPQQWSALLCHALGDPVPKRV